MVTCHSNSEKGNPLHNIGYSFQLAARFLLYESSHSLCYTSHGALTGTRNSSMGPPRRIDAMTYHTTSERSYYEDTIAPPNTYK